jgi:hypothetical protein
VAIIWLCSFSWSQGGWLLDPSVALLVQSRFNHATRSYLPDHSYKTGSLSSSLGFFLCLGNNLLAYTWRVKNRHVGRQKYQRLLIGANQQSLVVRFKRRLCFMSHKGGGYSRSKHMGIHHLKRHRFSKPHRWSDSARWWVIRLWCCVLDGRQTAPTSSCRAHRRTDEHTHTNTSDLKQSDVKDKASEALSWPATHGQLGWLLVGCVLFKDSPRYQTQSTSDLVA